MNRENIEDLLHNCNRMSQEIEQIKTNSKQMNELLNDLEAKVKHAGSDLDSLYKDIDKLEMKFDRVEPLLRRRIRNCLFWRVG
ncbi:hypothetical protein ACFOGI_14910 [Virgibacillus xinjiangensis]|uniref:t-SNARE coiled-coil homology domain-containing protein n=1 Tax=Virgibacillus xinjiangensis TaxID=393090 RepID=A0ABV7CZD4_9BACI